MRSSEVEADSFDPIAAHAGTLRTVWNLAMMGHKPKITLVYGGDDGARTRDLCRDSKEVWRNTLKSGATDGTF